MAISTYSELKTAVANWLNRDTLTAYVPDFIMLGEMRIYRELRIRAMEASLSSAISSGTVSLPADYVELKHARIDGTPVQPLQRKTAEWIYEKYPTRSSDSKPKFIAQDQGVFIFGPYPDDTYTVKGTYYKRLTALSDSNTTNWFVTNAPDLLLWASLCEAEPFLKNDERVLLWEGKYAKTKVAVEDEDRRERLSGSTLAASVS